MDNKNKIPRFQSIRTRILIFVFAIVLLGIILTAVVGISGILRLRDNNLAQIDQVMESQIDEYLSQIASDTALQNDLIIDRARQDAQYLAYYTRQLFSTDSQIDFDQTELFEGSSGQFSNSPEATTSVFVPNFQTVTDDIQETVAKTNDLETLLKTIYENNTSIVAVYFGTENEVTRYYPNINLGDVLPPNFQVTKRPWYIEAVTDNPTNQVKWSSVYEDSTGKGFLVTAAAPVTDSNGDLVGVIGIDITLTEISSNVNTPRLMQTSYAFLLEKSGTPIVLTEDGYEILFDQPYPDSISTINMLDPSNPILSTVEDMLSGGSGIDYVQLKNEKWIIAYSPMSSTEWSLGIITPYQEIFSVVPEIEENFNQSIITLLVSRLTPLWISLIALTVLLSIWLSRRIVSPIQSLATASQRIAEGDYDTELPPPQQDETGVLIESFKSMSAQISNSLATLEDRVDERTKELSERSNQIQAAAELGQAVANIRNLDELLTRVTHLISDRFGFYHVGVFLLDENNQYAVLRAANSPGGQRMLARNHRLGVGTMGIVGYVTGSRQARIALDVGRDAIYFDNPDLPDTRSEMALPLIASGNLLGALDVQSTESGAFTNQDIETLQLLADQVAISIYNARLYQETQDSLNAIQRAYGEMTRDSWSQLLQSRSNIGYHISPQGKISTSEGDWSPSMEMAIARDEPYVDRETNTLAVPINIRDNPTGAICFTRKLSQGEWTQTEIEMMQNLTNQLGTALEAARLYSETQRRAEREHLVTEITSRIRATNDPQQMLQTAVQELQEVLRVKRAQVVIQPKIDMANDDIEDPGNNGKGLT